jgi:prepilin-type N-terminal cleavage/methylation domain-containing protein
MQHRRAFTLIELLVVVTIIVMLLAILMPAMSKAMFLAHRAVCFSNLRQSIISVTNYGVNHFGLLPYSGRNYPHMSVLDVFEMPTTLPTRDYLHCPNDSFKPGYWAAWWKFVHGVDMTAANHLPVTEGPVEAVAPYSYYWQTKMYRDASNALLQQRAIRDVKHPGRLIVQHCRGEQSDFYAGYVNAGGQNSAFIDGHAAFHRWDEINPTAVSWQGKPNTDWTWGGIAGADVN